MEQMLQGMYWKSPLLYLDDLIVISPDFPTCPQHLEEVFQSPHKADLALKPTKCEQFQKKVRYLGHFVSADGVLTDPEKIVTIKELPPPQILKELQTFFGTVEYYHEALRDIAMVARRLNQLTAKGAEWE